MATFVLHYYYVCNVNFNVSKRAEVLRKAHAARGRAKCNVDNPRYTIMYIGICIIHLRAYTSCPVRMAIFQMRIKV